MFLGSGVNCYKDYGGNRQLPVYLNKDNSLTIERCIDKCKGRGYAYAGVQFYKECWCGNEMPKHSAPKSDCNTPCSGNQKQMCGGNLSLNVFKTGRESHKEHR